MGLTAVVFNTKKNIISKTNINNSFLLVDEETGEVYMKDSPNSEGNTFIDNIHTEEFLGNISQIEFLNKKLSKILTEDSLILSKIVYNGSHSGDVVSVKEIKKLTEELITINSCNLVKTNKDIIVFAEALSRLINASDITKNPIVVI